MALIENSQELKFKDFHYFGHIKTFLIYVQISPSYPVTCSPEWNIFQHVGFGCRNYGYYNIRKSTEIRTIWKYVGKPSHTKLDVNLKLTMLAPSIMADI